MVRQWQEFFYESNYESTPLVSPDFVKLADAHGIAGRAVRTRSRGRATLSNEARRHKAHSCSTSWSKRKTRCIR